MQVFPRLGMVFGIASVVVAMTPSVAWASWPMARHDAKRSGSTAGTANLIAPVPYWRAYLGGALGGNQLLVADVMGNGSQALLMATGGQVIAKDTTDAVIWKAGSRGITALAGVGDLDGDGVPDVVAYSDDHVIVLSIRTGTIEWVEPDGEMGSLGAVRVGDVTGDGKPDIVVVECGCCGVNSGNSGFIWSFGSGFGSAARLGSLAVFACGTSHSVSLVQADTSAKLEILLADESHFALLGQDGSVLAQTGTIGTNTSVNACTTANIDGVPGDEAVCLLNSSDAPATNQRRITVLHYDYGSQPPALDVLWSNVVAPDAGGDMHWVDPLVDLDGDGTFEIVASTEDPINGWRTHIYDAVTGNELVSAIPSQVVGGTVAMLDKIKRTILTTNGTTVSGWGFARSPTPAVTQQWSFPNLRVLDFPDLTRLALVPVGAEVLATDLNGDGLQDVILNALSATASAGLQAYSAAGGTTHQIANLTLPAETDLLSAWIVPPVSTSFAQPAIVRTDGVLNLLGGDLKPTARGTSPAEIDVHVGGYYATGAWRELYDAPRVVSLDGGPVQAVLVDDSRGALLRLDAAAASWAVPPTPTWQLTHAFGPTVVSRLDGSNPGIACLAIAEPVTDPPTYHVRAVRGDGTVIWDKTIAGFPLNDLVPGTFNSDTIPDFAFQTGDLTDANLVTMAFSGADGSSIWATQPMYPGPGGVQSAGVSVGQWSGSGHDDVCFQGGATTVLSGATGAQVTSGGTPNAYSLPMLYDTNGDGQDEVLLSAGFWPVTLFTHDLTTALWTSSDTDRPYPYGAIAQCSGAPPALILVEGSWENPARLKFTPLNGQAVGTYTTVVVAGGKEYPTETAAKAAGAFLGQLSAANVHSNLTGKGRPTVVVGSGDGWLYGLNPCDTTMDFSVDLGAAAGEAVFGDTDGDGIDEILVSAADGYLYDLKNPAIAAPSYVWDTDPEHGVTNHEVSSIVTTNKLSAAWGTVAGATGYAVQVVTPTGTLVSMPPWQQVGLKTSISLTGLSLTDGAKYLFAVRALSSAGPSVDAISSGVTVHFPGSDGGIGNDGGTDASIDAGPSEGGSAIDGAANQEAGGASGGCGCRVASRSRGCGWIAVLFGLPLALALRRRRGQAC